MVSGCGIHPVESAVPNRRGHAAAPEDVCGGDDEFEIAGFRQGYLTGCSIPVPNNWNVASPVGHLSSVWSERDFHYLRFDVAIRVLSMHFNDMSIDEPLDGQSLLLLEAYRSI